MKTSVVIVLGRESIRLPKFGWLRIVRHRKSEGQMKNVTLMRESERWFAHIVLEGRPSLVLDGSDPTSTFLLEVLPKKA